MSLPRENWLNATVNTDGSLNISSSASSSKNDFDFFIGEWKIINKKLKSRLKNCEDWQEFDATQDTSGRHSRRKAERRDYSESTIPYF
jgi:hypothetical protein